MNIISHILSKLQCYVYVGYMYVSLQATGDFAFEQIHGVGQAAKYFTIDPMKVQCTS